jgi:hypothetical protein
LRHIKDNTSESNVNSKVVIYSWRDAKKEATAQLAEMRVRTARLKAAIKLFTEKEKAGEPWPGQSRHKVTQKAGTAKEAIPA